MRLRMTSAPTFRRIHLWVFPSQHDINYCSPTYTCAFGMYLTPHIMQASATVSHTAGFYIQVHVHICLKEQWRNVVPNNHKDFQ